MASPCRQSKHSPPLSRSILSPQHTLDRTGRSRSTEVLNLQALALGSPMPRQRRTLSHRSCRVLSLLASLHVAMHYLMLPDVQYQGLQLVWKVHCFSSATLYHHLPPGAAVAVELSGI